MSMFAGESNRVGILIETLLPKDTNSHGSIFGGIIMSIMDKAAGVAAWKYAQNPVVTAGVEQITFHTPIQVGEVVRATATVIYTGRTSIDIEVLVEATEIIGNTKRVAASGIFTMVAIDAAKRAKAVPAFTPETALEKKKYQAAAARRSVRKSA
jgi:acyl-CoA hydrolase